MKYFVSVVIILILILGGCGSAPPAFPSAEPSFPSADEMMPGQVGGFSFGESAAWPDYLPEDIPPIPANITTVMASSDHVRIFFDGLPQSGFDAYLELLKSKGYTLEYIAYQMPGMTEEDALAGGYDAVRATNGTYSLSIEYGGDGGTYDIDAKGLPEGSIKTSPDWPKELEGIIGPPEGSTVRSVFPAADGSFEITCESESSTLLEDYMAALTSRGFEEKNRSTDNTGGIIEVKYYKDGVSVSLTNYLQGTIGITVKTDAAPQDNFGLSANGGWPGGLPASLPPYAGNIQSSLVITDKMVKIMADIKSEADIDGYRALLTQSGFTAEDGEGRVYSNADCIVTIDEMMQANFFSITVELK